MLGRQKGCQQYFHSFLLHCETKILMPQIQILPNFDTAEIQASVLGGGLGNEIQVKGERGARTGPECHSRNLNFKHLTIRECGKFDTGSRRSLS